MALSVSAAMQLLRVAVFSTSMLILTFCSTQARADWSDSDYNTFPTAAAACQFRASKLQKQFGRRAKITWSLTPTPLHPAVFSSIAPNCFLTISKGGQGVGLLDPIGPTCNAGFTPDRNAISGCVPPKADQPVPTTVNIFIGGFFDGTYHPVESYLRPSNPVQIPNHHYFSHDAESKIREFIATLPTDAIINIIGHSYGGDTAVDVAITSGRPINLLITIDPVNSRNPTFPNQQGSRPGAPSSDEFMDAYRIKKYKALRPQTRTWIDVNAHPSESDSSDTVASIGGKWAYLPNSPVRYDDVFIDAVGLHHAQFEQMMQYRGPGGKSAQDLLLGN